MNEQQELTVIRYEVPAPKVARITLARPEARNAQDTRLLYELNSAFDRAAQDDDISVVVLAADGPHFSSGHDLRERDGRAAHGRARHRRARGAGSTAPAPSRRWPGRRRSTSGSPSGGATSPSRPSPRCRGKVIAGGLMLVWPCDLVVAADGAEFIDNTVAMGVCGAEFFQHPWEVGVRKAKEMLFTSDALHRARSPAAGDGQPRRRPGRADLVHHGPGRARSPRSRCSP